ncbi:endoribonuclease YbeY [Alicyclobacillus hesperidum subsp. aegles]|uniref:rRNA maturation RNase YbeY n=1 Tax=Alicyclobacillus hesperidum TaxID=89784 RepID=UPI000724CB93|nr:rRNA maturation RNase YbeY [Alicyclobacillus hesperidum]KRW91708.1 rRNA maturation factor [Alicyclobacillus tengchongensis]GLG00299.1 endoribonuclease YbeY [Alicyclobacillus hesperidum subsp. aegles]
MTAEHRLAIGVECEVDWPWSDAGKDPQSFVQRVLEAAANRLDIEGEVSVLFVDDETIHELNRTYRQVDRPTDVLSFAMLEGEETPQPEGELPVLGDIVVSIDTAKVQAESYGHSLEREMAFLLVHGFLHLNGYDHAEPDEEREMFALQEEILQGIGLSRG